MTKATMMQKIGAVLMAVVLSTVCGAAFAEDVWDVSQVMFQAGDVEYTAEEQAAGNPIFEIVMADGGVMRGELYPEIAPESVGNFIALANSGYYDGLIFHRVIPGFMIQGGCPLGIGIGNPGWSIKGEFADNGVPNDLQHTEGVLSMARSGMPDSAGSQFFIMTSDSPFLDGQYAAFGKVLSGMDAAFEIVNVQRDAQDKPLADQAMLTVRVETFDAEYSYSPM